MKRPSIAALFAAALAAHAADGTGITAYHYHHHAEERWSGDCLSALAANTDDDGKPASVELAKNGDANQITTRAGSRSEPGCLMSYAYWNPAMREQRRLLNPQTGKVDAVKVERVASGNVVAGGESPVDVWISAQGGWVGLDSMVGHGRHELTYRLPWAGAVAQPFLPLRSTAACKQLWFERRSGPSSRVRNAAQFLDFWTVPARHRRAGKRPCRTRCSSMSRAFSPWPSTSSPSSAPASARCACARASPA
jgi:hypothetical protein